MRGSKAPAHLRAAPEAGTRVARPAPAPAWVIVGAGVVLAAVAAVALPEASWARAVVAVLLAVALAAAAVVDHARGLLAVTAFLATLGLLRRLVSMVQADPTNDPLLLVAPAVAAVFVLLAWRGGATRHPTALSWAVGAFLAISVVTVVNPTVSLVSNLQGLLFWSIPLLWFPLGRTLADGLIRRVIRLVAVLGIGACVTGVVQATIAFPPWDERWIDARGYIALGVSGQDTLRPFGWSSSAGEFALTAAITAVLCGLFLLQAFRARSRWGVALFGFGVGVASAALILSAVRTAVLLGLVAVGVVVIAQRQTGFVRVAGGLLAAVVLLVGGVRVLDVESWYDHGITGLLRRSLVGLTKPFDAKESSLSGHLELTGIAWRTLDDRPLGGGPAFGTTPAPESPRAAADDTGGVGDLTDQRDPDDGPLRSAENDLGNAMLAFGIPGGLLVLAITALGLRTLWQNVGRWPSLATLAALGVLVASLRFWFTGAHYAPAMLVWLLLGWSDRPERPAP